MKRFSSLAIACTAMAVSSLGCQHEPTDDELIQKELASGAKIAPSIEKNRPPLPARTSDPPKNEAAKKGS